MIIFSSPTQNAFIITYLQIIFMKYWFCNKLLYDFLLKTIHFNLKWDGFTTNLYLI